MSLRTSVSLVIQYTIYSEYALTVDNLVLSIHVLYYHDINNNKHYTALENVCWILKTLLYKRVYV